LKYSKIIKNIENHSKLENHSNTQKSFIYSKTTEILENHLKLQIL